MDFRSVGGFSIVVAAVVALAVGAVLLLSNGGDDPTRAPAAPRPVDLPCEVETLGGAARIVFSPSNGSCPEAQRAYATFSEMLRRGEASGYDLTEVGAWTCREYPFSEYPLLARCEQNERQFEVLGTAPSAHAGEEAYQP